jgi:hypothetical protein
VGADAAWARTAVVSSVNCDELVSESQSLQLLQRLMLNSGRVLNPKP